MFRFYTFLRSYTSISALVVEKHHLLCQDTVGLQPPTDTTVELSPASTLWCSFVCLVQKNISEVLSVTFGKSAGQHIIFSVLMC